MADVNRLAKPPNGGLSDDEAKGSGNENDSIKIHPITYRDVQSATEKIYNGGINKTNLQVSPTRGVNQRNIRTHPRHTFLKPRRSNSLSVAARLFFSVICRGESSACLH